MNREDLKLLPLVAIGLAKGIGEYVVKPYAIDAARKAGQIVLWMTERSIPMDHGPQAASIQYYRTPEQTESGANQASSKGES